MYNTICVYTLLPWDRVSTSISSKFTNAKVTFISNCIVTDTVRTRIEHHIVLLVGQLCSKENIYLIAHKVKQAKYGQTACRQMCEDKVTL